MSYPINYPTPQNCDVQMFYGVPVSAASTGTQRFDWVKPKGSSFVWFTLIGTGGRGGDGDGVDEFGGGGSGGVTNCLMPAFLVPDQLRVSISATSNTAVLYQGPQASAGYSLLTSGNGGVGGAATGGSAGAAITKTAFAAAGIYQSVAGQAGVINVALAASTTTFLSGGHYSVVTTPNYGYPASSSAVQSGFFQVSPIFVGRGGVNTGNNGAPGGIGCGGGGSGIPIGSLGGAGGAGMVAIISW